MNPVDLKALLKQQQDEFNVGTKQTMFEKMPTGGSVTAAAVLLNISVPQ